MAVKERKFVKASEVNEAKVEVVPRTKEERKQKNFCLLLQLQRLLILFL